MNLYLLVEGQKTEKDVYRSWLTHTFPGIRPAATMAEMTGDAYYILSGYGVPSYIRRIHDALEDIRDTPTVDHFLVCVDAEELTYEARYEEVAGEIARQEAETGARRGNPSFKSHVIVQNCCIETWFLGHRKMMRKSPSSPILARYRRFYDVREDDPEGMRIHPEFRTRAQFHLAYLKEMLLDQSPRLRYSKQSPGCVLEAEYLEALRHRVTSTEHLDSLRRLLGVWEGLTPDAR